MSWLLASAPPPAASAEAAAAAVAPALPVLHLGNFQLKSPLSRCRGGGSAGGRSRGGAGASGRCDDSSRRASALHANWQTTSHSWHFGGGL